MSVKILAIDTSTENCSVALVVSDQIVDSQWYVRRNVAPRGHAQQILPMVDEVLREAGVTLTELDALAFGRGPGSFTGVRICIGITQGLALGADLPVIPVSTLEAMAQGSYRLSGETHVATAIDARMNEVYWGRFSRNEDGRWTPTDPACVIAPALLIQQMEPDVHTWSRVGTGWGAYPDMHAQLPITTQSSDMLYPDAEDIAYLATLAYERGEMVAVEDASPVYLRDKVAWKKMPGRE